MKNSKVSQQDLKQPSCYLLAKETPKLLITKINLRILYQLESYSIAASTLRCEFGPKASVVFQFPSLQYLLCLLPCQYHSGNVFLLFTMLCLLPASRCTHFLIGLGHYNTRARRSPVSFAAVSDCGCRVHSLNVHLHRRSRQVDLCHHQHRQHRPTTCFTNY